MTFGERVRIARNGRSMYEVAKIAGISVPYWSDIEHGKKLPSADAAERMCRAVGGVWRDWARTLVEERIGPELWRVIQK